MDIWQNEKINLNQSNIILCEPNESLLLNIPHIAQIGIVGHSENVLSLNVKVVTI